MFRQNVYTARKKGKGHRITHLNKTWYQITHFLQIGDLSSWSAISYKLYTELRELHHFLIKGFIPLGIIMSNQATSPTAKKDMIALQSAPMTAQTNLKAQQQSGIISERSAIVLCGLGVAVFTIPILVVIHALSGLFWGGVTVYKLLNNSGFDGTEEV